jgi:hypothetical protein
VHGHRRLRPRQAGFAIGDDGTAMVISPADRDDEIVQDIVAECLTAVLRLAPGDKELPRS